MAGAGFGVFEAVWVFNTIFASGFNWHSVEVGGYMALLGFWERLFSVGFHIAISALAGYGLARRLGWQFYLIASVLHGAANYSVVRYVSLSSLQLSRQWRYGSAGGTRKLFRVMCKRRAEQAC